MEHSDDRVYTLKYLKTYPDKLVTLYDFGLDKVDWTSPTDDDLVALYKYKQDLAWENLINTLTTGERIPAYVWAGERLTSEFPMFSYEEIYDMAFRGGEIDDVMRRSLMDESELQELDAVMQAFEPEFEEEFARALDKVLKESEQVRELDALLYQDESDA